MWRSSTCSGRENQPSLNIRKRGPGRGCGWRAGAGSLECVQVGGRLPRRRRGGPGSQDDARPVREALGGPDPGGLPDCGGDGPAQHQLDSGLWARDLVRQIIASRLGVGFFLLSVGRVMHQLGMSPQRSLHRAWQSDPAAVAAWQQQVYPGIAADMKTRGRPSISAMRSRCARTSTRAPPGCRPRGTRSPGPPGPGSV